MPTVTSQRTLPPAPPKSPDVLHTKPFGQENRHHTPTTSSTSIHSQVQEATRTPSSYADNNRTAEKLNMSRGTVSSVMESQQDALPRTPGHSVTSHQQQSSHTPKSDIASLSSRVNESVYSHQTSAPAAPSQSQSHAQSQSQSQSQSRRLPDESDMSVESHIRNQIRPVTNQELTEALELIQYDVHREVHAVIREQVRQFSIAKVSVYSSYNIFRIYQIYVN